MVKPLKIRLTGKETFTITGISEDIKPLREMQVIAKKEDGIEIKFNALQEWIQLKLNITGMEEYCSMCCDIF